MINRTKLITAAVVLFGLQLGWWATLKGGAYERMMPRVQGTPLIFDWGQAALANSLLLVGFGAFVIPCMASRSGVTDKMMCAFLFGAVLSGFHNFCNAAILTNWDMRLGMLDVLWTATAFAVTAWVVAMV